MVISRFFLSSRKQKYYLGMTLAIYFKTKKNHFSLRVKKDNKIKLSMTRFYRNQKIVQTNIQNPRYLYCKKLWRNNFF